MEESDREGREGSSDRGGGNFDIFNFSGTLYILAPRKPVGSGIKPTATSRIQSRPTGMSKIGGGGVAKTTPTTKQVKSAPKASAGKASSGNTASAAEIKALTEENTRLQDQVRLCSNYL